MLKSSNLNEELCSHLNLQKDINSGTNINIIKIQNFNLKNPNKLNKAKFNNKRSNKIIEKNHCYETSKNNINLKKNQVKFFINQLLLIMHIKI